MFSKEQFLTLLKSQSALNGKYVPEWSKQVSREKFTCAFITEFAEFLESAPRFYQWKWWKPTLQDDIQNIKVEIVDMLHFGLSLALLKTKTPEDPKDDIIDYGLFIAFHNNDLKRDVNFADFMKSFDDVIKHKDSDPTELFLAKLVWFLEYLVNYVNWSYNDLYNAYWKKNELNLKRIKEGYMEGKYQKIDQNGQEDNRQLDI